MFSRDSRSSLVQVSYLEILIEDYRNGQGKVGNLKTRRINYRHNRQVTTKY